MMHRLCTHSDEDTIRHASASLKPTATTPPPPASSNVDEGAGSPALHVDTLTRVNAVDGTKDDEWVCVKVWP